MPSAVHTPISALDIFKLLVEKGPEHLGRAHIKPLIEAFDRLLLLAVYILKEKGNGQLKLGNNELALAAYNQAVDLISWLSKEWLDTKCDPENRPALLEKVKAAQAAIVQCLGNKALALSRMSKHAEVVVATTKILEMRPKDKSQRSKALFRRAEASLATKDNKKSLQDIKIYLQMVPKCEKALRIRKEAKKAIKKAEKRVPSLIQDGSSSEYSGSSDCEIEFFEAECDSDSDGGGVGDDLPPLRAPKRSRSSKSAPAAAAAAAPGWAAAVKTLTIGAGGDSAAKKKKKKKSPDAGAKTGTYVCGNLIPESLEGQLKNMSKEERSLVSHFVGESLPEPDTESDSCSFDGTEEEMMTTLIGDKDASSDASSYGGAWSDSDCDDGEAGARSKPRSKLAQDAEAQAFIDAVGKYIAAQGTAETRKPTEREIARAIAVVHEELKCPAPIQQLNVGGLLDLLASRDTKDQDDIPGAKAGAKAGPKVGGITAMPKAKKAKAEKVKKIKTDMCDSDSSEYCPSLTASGTDSDSDNGDDIIKGGLHARARRAEASAAKAKADAATLASTRAAEKERKKERKKQASALAKAQAAEAEERAAREAAEKAELLAKQLILEEEEETRRREDKALKEKEKALREKEKKEEKKRRKAEEAACKLRQEEERKAQQERIHAEAEEAKRVRESDERERAEKEEKKRRKEAEKADKLRLYQERQAAEAAEEALVRRQLEAQAAAREKDSQLRSQALHAEQARILAEAHEAKRSRDVDHSERAREMANDDMYDAVDWGWEAQANLGGRMEEENELEAGMDPRPVSARPLQVDAPPFQSQFNQDEALALRMQEEESAFFEKFGGMELYASADNFSVASTVNSSSPAIDSRCAAVTPGFQDDVVHGIDQDNACIICWENPKEYCFNPCGHLQLCGGCLEKERIKRPEKMAQCYVCATKTVANEEERMLHKIEAVKRGIKVWECSE